MAKKQKQVCDIKPSKGFGMGLSNEQLRVASNGAYDHNEAGTLDPTRSQLNFEISKGGEIQEVDKTKSIPRRIKEILNDRKIDDPNAGLEENDPNRRRIVANIILEGSTETMRKLAFGDQDVNWDKGADNSHISRKHEIEQWAIDMYNFIAKKYGEENIAAFVVHLDETLPHAHCTLLPITQQNKFSWKQVFAGEDKFEYSRRMKTLHDELAAINKRWGLERGEPVELTGAKHKSYNQWLDEIIKGKEDTIREKESIIGNLNSELKKAQIRLKGLSKMLSNLEAKKSENEEQISMLEEKVRRGELKHEDVTERIRTLMALKKETEEKIEDKKTKLKTAEDQLENLLDRKAEIEEDIMAMQKKINTDLPTLHQKVVHDMDAELWRVAAEDMKERYEKIPSFVSTLSPQQRADFNNLFENSIFELMAEKANEVSAVAAALFLGYADQATQFAQGHGGGGSGPGTGWGKKDDEDDWMWRRRCAMMGMRMMKKGSKLGLKR